jgi:hypothetical protein
VTATLTDADRTILGVLAPYDRTSVDGSIRSIRGCFSDSPRAPRAPLPLLLGQGRGRPEVAVGLSTLWSNDPADLTVTFHVKPGSTTHGQDRTLTCTELLADIAGDYMSGLAAEYRASVQCRADDGALEVIRAVLVAAALVATPPVETATVRAVGATAIRKPEVESRCKLPPRPVVDLTPVETWDRRGLRIV